MTAGEANRDLETSETEDSYVNGLGGHGSSNRAGAGGVSEVGDHNENDDINKNRLFKVWEPPTKQSRIYNTSLHRIWIILE